MQCPSCKEKIDDDSLYCEQCGKQIIQPWVSNGGRTCTNLEEIAQALMAESAFYMEDLKKPNSHLYLYLKAVEGARGAAVSNMFLKFFTESGYTPKRALAMVCAELQGKPTEQNKTDIGIRILLVLRTIFLFFYRILKRILTKIFDIIDDIAAAIDYETSSYIVSGILAAGIAFGSYVLLDSILAAVGVFLLSYLITIYIAFSRDFGYRPIKLLIILGLSIAGATSFFTTITKSTDANEPMTATVSSDLLNIYKNPTSNESVKSLKKGDNILVLGNSTNGWTLVRDGNSIGYVMSPLISVAKQVAIVKAENLILFSRPFINSDILKILKKGDILNVTGNSFNDWTPVKYGNLTGYVSSYLITIKNLAATATITASSLILYSEPSTSSTTLKFLKKGEALTITGSSSKGWIPVKSDNTKGWVALSSIAIDR